MFENEIRDAVNEVFEDFCPETKKCPVHYRNDRETLIDEAQMGSFITYIGNYAVMTGDNVDLTEMENMILSISALMGTLAPEDFPYYEVCVVEVGDGTLADVKNRVKEEGDHFTLYVHKFSKWEDFASEHKAVVEKLKAGELDLTSYQAGLK